MYNIITKLSSNTKFLYKKTVYHLYYQLATLSCQIFASFFNIYSLFVYFVKSKHDICWYENLCNKKKSLQRKLSLTAVCLCSRQTTQFFQLYTTFCINFFYFYFLLISQYFYYLYRHFHFLAFFIIQYLYNSVIYKIWWFPIPFLSQETFG